MQCLERNTRRLKPLVLLHPRWLPRAELHRRSPALPIALVLVLTAAAACGPTQAWRISSVTPLSGARACNSVEGFGLLEPYNDDRPFQPLGGDWWEGVSPHAGNLLKDAAQLPAGAYFCGVAQVTVERDPAVQPSKVWQSGQNVQLYVTHAHATTNINQEKGNLQPLLYVTPVIIDGQTVVTFTHVILLSAPSQTEFESTWPEYLQTNGQVNTPVYFGQWPDKAGTASQVLGDLKKRGHVQAKDCQIKNHTLVSC